MKMFDLTGRNAIVTGANGAIGSCISKVLLSHGANVFLVGSNGSTMDNIPGIIGQISVDITHEGAIQKIFNSALSACPKIDILVNCIGISVDNLFLKITEDEWDSQINVNLKSTWLLTQAALKHMMRNKYGRIVSISSVIARIGNVGQTVYATTKSGLYGMTRSLAREVASRGITVNTVSPGFIESQMTQKLMENQELKSSILANVPLGYIGKPEDVASAVLYLVSDEARYVTGADIQVSGGMYMN